MTYEEFREKICDVTKDFCKSNNVTKLQCDFRITNHVVVSISKREELKCDNFKTTIE